MTKTKVRIPATAEWIAWVRTQSEPREPGDPATNQPKIKERVVALKVILR